MEIGLTKDKDSNACYHSYLWNPQPEQAHPGHQLQKTDSLSSRMSLTDQRTLIKLELQPLVHTLC